MRSAFVLCALISLSGCESAAKHPAITVGTVAGTMGFGLCELSVAELGTCGIIGGVAALGLGGITALVTLLADTTAHEEPATGETQPGGTEGPPGLPEWMKTDAGVPPQPAPDWVKIDVNVDVTIGDAGVPRSDAAVSDAM
jgi:hypothetical protein